MIEVIEIVVGILCVLIAVSALFAAVVVYGKDIDS